MNNLVFVAGTDNDNDGEGIEFANLLQFPCRLCLPLFQHGHVEGKSLVDFPQGFLVLARQPKTASIMSEIIQ